MAEARDSAERTEAAVTAQESSEAQHEPAEDQLAVAERELAEFRDKYLRLYAEFENYKKKTVKDKEELARYGNEAILYEVLPVIDTLEMALKHSSEGNKDALQALVQGVENTLREMIRVLEKFGLKAIEAVGQPFDPAFHHAMTQVVRDDAVDNTVVEEYRKGYQLRDKVLRPSLVVVSKRP